ncbi:MAG: hypothetical protein P8P87_02815 [Crocinitomicaceae bacterium]|nr:hypothetical protein [Crocinitomicaceae bacterium]
MKILNLFIILFVALKSFGQDSLVVVMKVIDAKYEDPIQNVTASISYDSTQFFKSTSRKGELSFQVPMGVKLNYGLTHPRFNSISSFIRISSRERLDTIVVEIEIDGIRLRDLDEIVISTPGKPDTVFSSDRLHVQDFEILPDGRLILLSYPKRLKKRSELILYDGNIVNNFEIPGRAYELVSDYRGNPHIICEKNVFGIYIYGKRIEIATLDKEYFTKYVAPIVDTNTTKMYFTTFNPDFPAMEYFSFDQLDSAYSKILGIQDDLMMELYRSEIKWVDVRTRLWAKNLELQTGVDAEVYVGANYFTQSPYYKELYAPLFHRNDTLFVFDYYKDKLYTFNADGDSLDSIPIYHHYQPKRTGWKKNLIQDGVTGHIYAVYDRSGYTYLGSVDTKTGEITEQVKLEFRYAKKFVVEGNFVYYIYRPFESTQKKFLYKERLPYDFGKASVPGGDEVGAN